MKYHQNRIYTGTQTLYAGSIGTVSQRHNIALDVRIIDPKSGEYLTNAKVDASEKGKTGLGGAGSNPAVFLSAIDQIKLDVSWL